MSRQLRIVLVACAGLLALAFAAPALAKYEPKLIVTTTGQTVGINATLANDDDPTARITFYAPAGWTANLTQPSGTVLGPVTGMLNALDLDPQGGGQLLPVTGTVRTADPAAFVANPCSPGIHQAVWVLALVAAGNDLQPVPLYVDATTGAEAAFSSYKIVICLPPRDLPPGTPGRATFGVKLVQASFTTTNVFTPGASNRWTGLFIPYVAGSPTGAVNVPNSAESQALTGTASRLRITARRISARRARITGRLTAGGEPIGAATVRLTGNGRSVGRARTNDNGSFTKIVRITRTTMFRGRATKAASEEAGGCDPLLPLPTGGAARCTVVTTGAVSATSNGSRVTVPKRKPRRRR